MFTGLPCHNLLVSLFGEAYRQEGCEREREKERAEIVEREIVMEVLTELMEVKKRSYEERKKNIDTAKEDIICIEKQKIEIELRKEAREQKKEAREIMMMDTRHLSPIQLEYFQYLQMEIM
jgi:hypothetical protein